MAKKRNISAPKRGLNRDTHPSQLENTEYSFCMNCTTENETGESLNITNEPSNYLAVEFPEGYKVIGQEKHPTLNRTYYFLTNPQTGYSSVGIVDNMVDVTFQPDTAVQCDDCQTYNTLPTPLEQITQIAYNSYEEYFNDLCNKEFNFSIDFPIKHIEIKEDKLGTKVYWADNRNPDRYYNADDLEYYKYTGNIVCGVDMTTPVCVNTDKMRQEPEYSIPIITPEVLQIGGNLRMGSYEFMAAYCDKTGNEISQYYSITQQIPIFDANNRVLDQTELDSFTNFAIRLTVENLDERFQYYKVIVIERVAVNQAESYFEEGIHLTSDKDILYTSTQTGTENLGGITKRIPYERIMAQKVRYEKSKGLEASSNQLFKWGLTGKKYPNLQPIVNIIGGFVKWQSTVAKEILYKNSIACAKYRGYMREEVQPFGIKFFNKDGSEYPINPLVPRPPTASELALVDTDDINLRSVLANGSSCTTSDREKVWQVFNTATVEGVCSDFTGNGQVIEETDTSLCVTSDVATLPNSNIEIPAANSINNLEQYINDNLEDISNPSSDIYQPTIAAYLTATYPQECTPVFNKECSSPTLISSFNRVQEVVNAEYDLTYDENAANYAETVPPTFCQPFQIDGQTGQYVRDVTFQSDHSLTTVYKRQGNFLNESCSNAVAVINNNAVGTPPQGYYSNYYGSVTIGGLQDNSKTISTTNSYFFSGLHKGALYYKVDKQNRDRLILEITQNSQCVDTDDIPQINQSRLSIFATCASATPLYSEIVNTTTGNIVIVDVSALPNNFYVTVEPPIVTSTKGYRTAPACGCYSVLSRDLTVLNQKITFDSIIFEKVQTYEAVCSYTLPEINECDPIPYEYGNFSYWESTDTYPDNEELYDSSKLVISPSDLTTLSLDQIQSFEQQYTTSTEDNYVLTPSLNLRCAPIKQYKFPSNTVSPFMGIDNAAPFSEGLIYPLGITIDNNVINTFLDIAVTNNLLTQKQREEIAGYEIVKGDNSVHKSIVANTVGFDMFKYSEKGNDVLYPNYPLNDLGNDLLQLENGNPIPHPTNAQNNHNFALMSPELALNRPTLPTEMIISGFQMGNSRGEFNDVDEHANWVLLTRTANNTATTLGIAEAILEQAIKTAEVAVQFDSWVIAGVSSGTNAPGSIAQAAAIASLALGFITGIFVKIGQYRLQWLRTIRDLGQPRNYSSYYVAEGFHNKFLKNTQTLRGISAAKYLKAGRFTFKDEHDGTTIKINNYNREDSTFVSTGADYPVEYPLDYRNYDNNTLSETNGSRTILSQNGGQQGQEIVRNSALPYITLRNYIPNQWGTLDSIKWLTTSYKKLLDQDNSCEPIFGGTVYISRDTQKRKHPLFKLSSLNRSNMLPFNYSFYNNVGTTRFFVDYESAESTQSLGATLFPDIDSGYNLDNRNQSNFYLRASSKFYLYYYGFASYLVETEVNTNFRYGRRELKDQYYPDIQGDMVEFTQEKNLSIKEQSSYFYNSVYSRQVTQTPFTIYPTTYSKEVYDKINDAENGIIRSLIDNSENELTDPWLIYRPLDKKEFSTQYGKLISLEDIGSGMILARFENKELLLNAIESINKQGAGNLELGSGDVFTSRPLEYDSGTQNTDYLRTPFGGISVDAKRGKIYLRNGQNISAISETIGERPSGMKNWFTTHLPYKILRQYPNLDIDNKYKGIGITMGYDSKFKRAFITKRDYIALPNTCLQFSDELGFYVNETICADPTLQPSDADVITKIEFSDVNYFQDVSWTVSFTGSWVSYHSTHPNYYIDNHNYFQVGFNDTETLWSNLMKLDSFQVMQGELQPFSSTAIIPNEQTAKYLNSISVNSEVKRWQNEWDFNLHNTIGFNKAVISNHNNNSGLLLLTQQRTLSDVRNYPQTQGNTQKILYTSQDGEHKFNYIYNRVKNINNNIPVYLWDANMINKQINPLAVSFIGKQTLEKLRGEWFEMTLINDVESRLGITFKQTINEENIYEN